VHRQAYCSSLLNSCSIPQYMAEHAEAVLAARDEQAARGADLELLTGEIGAWLDANLGAKANGLVSADLARALLVAGWVKPPAVDRVAQVTLLGLPRRWRLVRDRVHRGELRHTAVEALRVCALELEAVLPRVPSDLDT